MKNWAHLYLQAVQTREGDVIRVKGVASTPAKSRTGLRINPMGAQFKLPLPFLWQHDSDKPVGLVTNAKPSKAGITFEAEIPIVKEEGALKTRVDEAIHSLQYGLVTFVSVGIQAEEDGLEPQDDGSLAINKWEWLELSLATIPANREAKAQLQYGDAPTKEFIQSILDEKPAARGKGRPVVSLAGVTAKRKQEAKMKISEQIKSYEAKRASLESSLEEIMTQSAEAGETLDAEQDEKYEEIRSEIKAVDKHLDRLRDFEKVQAAKATPVRQVETVSEGSQQRAPQIRVTDNLPPGIEFARYAISLASARGNIMQALEIAKARYPDQPRIHRYLQTQVAAGTTTHTTWASPLAQADVRFVGDFVDYLRPATIVGKFGTGNIPSLRSVPFNVSIAGQTSGGGAGWVGEGAAKPLTKFAFERTVMPYTKLASIAVITDELLRFSSPSAEMLVRDQLAAAVIQEMDDAFTSVANSGTTNVKPASITNGVASPVTATGTTADYVRADVKTLLGLFDAAEIDLATGVWIMRPATARSLALMFNALGNQEFPGMNLSGGTFFGYPVIVSNNIDQVTGAWTSPQSARNIIILCNASDIWLADDGGVSIDASREASLEMDTAPSMKASGSGSPETSVESAMVSMFQTNSVAIRAEREIHWKLRRSAAVQYIKGVAYA